MEGVDAEVDTVLICLVGVFGAGFPWLSVVPVAWEVNVSWRLHGKRSGDDLSVEDVDATFSEYVIGEGAPGPVVVPESTGESVLKSWGCVLDVDGEMGEDALVAFAIAVVPDVEDFAAGNGDNEGVLVRVTVAVF